MERLIRRSYSFSVLLSTRNFMHCIPFQDVTRTFQADNNVQGKLELSAFVEEYYRPGRNKRLHLVEIKDCILKPLIHHKSRMNFNQDL